MDGIIVEGRVLERLEEGLFRAELPNGHKVFAHFSRKMKAEAIPILPGNKVLLEVSPYDLSRGRIAGVPACQTPGSESTSGGQSPERSLSEESTPEDLSFDKSPFKEEGSEIGLVKEIGGDDEEGAGGQVVTKVVEKVALGKGVSFS